MKLKSICKLSLFLATQLALIAHSSALPKECEVIQQMIVPVPKGEYHRCLVSAKSQGPQELGRIVSQNACVFLGENKKAVGIGYEIESYNYLSGGLETQFDGSIISHRPKFCGIDIFSGCSSSAVQTNSVGVAATSYYGADVVDRTEVREQFRFDRSKNNGIYKLTKIDDKKQSLTIELSNCSRLQ